MITIRLKNGTDENGETLYKEYPILADINTMEQIQEKYGNLSLLSEKIENLKELKWVLALMINEATDFNFYEHGITEKQISQKRVGMILPFNDVKTGVIIDKITAALHECIDSPKNEIA